MRECMHARIDGLLSSPWSYIEIGLCFVQFILLMLTKILLRFVSACSSGQQLLTSRVSSIKRDVWQVSARRSKLFLYPLSFWLGLEFPGFGLFLN
jgi:hypothetical protein